jgi:hypothetical protein
MSTHPHPDMPRLRLGGGCEAGHAAGGGGFFTVGGVDQRGRRGVFTVGGDGREGVGCVGGVEGRGVFTVGADCGGEEGAGLESICAVPPAMGAPQLPQNLVLGCSGDPHFRQRVPASASGCSAANGSEQLLQKCAVALFSAPQLGHFIVHPLFENHCLHRPYQRAYFSPGAKNWFFSTNV